MVERKYVIPGEPKRRCAGCGARARPGEMVDGRCWRCGGTMSKMRDYAGTVTVSIEDPVTMQSVTVARIEVGFRADEDPRELLTRRALEEALAAAQAIERWEQE